MAVTSMMSTYWNLPLITPAGSQDCFRVWGVNFTPYTTSTVVILQSRFHDCVITVIYPVTPILVNLGQNLQIFLKNVTNFLKFFIPASNLTANRSHQPDNTARLLQKPHFGLCKWK